MTNGMAHRTLTLEAGLTEVSVRVHAPVSDGGGYKCEYQICGVGDEKVRYAMGVDGIQALLLALRMIGTDLYTSEQGRAGLLTWHGSKNLGFPVPDVISDLLPGGGSI